MVGFPPDMSLNLLAIAYTILRKEYSCNNVDILACLLDMIRVFWLHPAARIFAATCIQNISLLIGTETYLSFYAKCPFYLSDFKQNWIASSNFIEVS